jgi:hypothetical protein
MGLQVGILPGTITAIWYIFFGDRIVFRVWDYRQNTSISFSVDLELNNMENYPEVYFLIFG